MPGTDEELVELFVLAAAREVFEETGVLLAVHADGTPVAEAEVDAPALVAGRAAVEARERSFTDLLAEHDLRVDTACLSVRDHWTTPECEPKRYDTWFFAARIPSGQEADADTSEAVHAGWERPADLVQRALATPGLMLPPTLANLEELSAVGSVDEALTDRGVVPEVMPWPAEVPVSEEFPDGLSMRTPWER